MQPEEQGNQNINRKDPHNNNTPSSPLISSASSSIIQVPSSSPISSSTMSNDNNDGTSPTKPNGGASETTSKIPSLRDKFSYKPGLGSGVGGVNTNSMTNSTNSSSSLSIELKRNFVALKNKYPNLNYPTILRALKTKGNLREASAYLATLPSEKVTPAPPVTSSPVKKGVAVKKTPNESSVVVPSSSPTKQDVQSSKVEINKPKSSIFEKYSNKTTRLKMNLDSIRNAPVPSRPTVDPNRIASLRFDSQLGGPLVTKPRGKLVRGSKYDQDDDDDMGDFIVDGNEEEIERMEKKARKAERALSKDEPKAKKPKKKEVVSLSDSEEEQLSDREDGPILLESGDDLDDDDDDMDVEEEEDEVNVKFEERVLDFLNTSDKRDIADIAGVPISIAALFVESRPFASLEDVENTQFDEIEDSVTPPPGEGSTGRARRKTTKKKPTGEKMVETAMRKLRGYDAADSLIKKCSEYGKVITSEIHKWGVSIHGEQGELEIVEVDVEKDLDDNDDDNDDDLKEISVVEVKDESKSTETKTDNMKKEEKGEEEDEEDHGEEEDADDDADGDDYESEEDVDSDDEYIKRKSRFSKKQQFNNQSINKTGYFHKKPKLLDEDISLKNYQQVGVNWLTLLYQKNLSCILADEMGLGKTIQVIAFIAHLKEKQCEGPHLIVVPSSTLENWLREFQKFAPDLIVKPYYGTQNARVELRAELEDSSQYDVLVTTYNLATGNKYDQNFLRSRSFNVVVYDEGHMLKNSNSDRYTKLMKLQANFRLLLTGTPLQNNLRELISLLAFILPKVFSAKRDDLQALFDQKVTTARDSDDTDENYNPLLSQQAITNARKMMAPFVLRRKKDQVMKYLPKKSHLIKYCELNNEQAEIYQKQLDIAKNAKLERDRRKLLSTEEIRKEDKLRKDNKEPPLQTSTNTIMQLRKASLHPMLFRSHFTDELLAKMAKDIMRAPEYTEANEEYIYEDMQVMTDFELNGLCLKFSNVLGDYILPTDKYLQSGKIKVMMDIVKEVIEKNEKVLIFSLFTNVLDILEKVLSYYNLKFLRLDGSTSVDERQDIIDKFYEDETIPVFLLSTRAGGFGINLICANNVIIFDQSFNPHDDKQAEDRAHRVGQTKEVHVYKLITKNTIEENISQMAENKLQLDDSMTITEEQTAKLVENALFK